MSNSELLYCFSFICFVSCAQCKVCNAFIRHSSLRRFYFLSDFSVRIFILILGEEVHIYYSGHFIECEWMCHIFHFGPLCSLCNMFEMPIASHTYLLFICWQQMSHLLKIQYSMLNAKCSKFNMILRAR